MPDAREGDMVAIPGLYAGVIRHREGEAGARWLRGLPELVAELCVAWDCTIDGAPRHGQVALVVPVRRDGEPAALKVSFPHEGNVSEGPALRTFDGRGAVRLLADDPDRFALLLERAGPGTPATLPTDAWIDIAAELSHAMAVPAGPDAPVLADTAAGWAEQLDAQLDAAPSGSTRAVTDAVIARARSAIDAVGDDRSATLVHGDLHAANVLESRRSPWLAIDPKGYRGPITWDAFTVAATPLAALSEYPDPPAEFWRLVRRFADAVGIDRVLAEEVSFARAVSSLLYEILGGVESFGLRFLTGVVERGR